MAFWHQYQPPPPLPPPSNQAFGGSAHSAVQPPPPLPPSNQAFGESAHSAVPNQGYQAWPPAPLPHGTQPMPVPGYVAPYSAPLPAMQPFQPPPNVLGLQQVQRPCGPPPFLGNGGVTNRPPLWTNSCAPPVEPVSMQAPDKPPEEEPKGDRQLGLLPPWLQNKVQAYESGKKAAPCLKPDTSPLVMLREALEALETLKQLETLAESLLHCEGDEQWSVLMQHVEVHQAKLLSRCKELSKEDVMSRLTTSIERRRKKRERLKRQRVRREQEAEEEKMRVATVEANINACRQRILDKANQERQEAEMKEEVDSILSEIRFKINRTREYLEKLEALKQLRAARKESYQQKGLYVASEADSNFQDGVASVQRLLEDQLSDYLKEETALKVMLETEQKEQYESSKLANKQEAVLRSLFGSTEVDPAVLPFNKLYTSSSESLESLAWVRNSWDQFLVPPDHPGGSSVPVQWVVPPEPSSHSWAMFCTS
uniref:Programmed cell death 7 n=1 Tax=Amblyomma maculatum TaxID=34609 RepID=G3ML26_AMBMU